MPLKNNWIDRETVLPVHMNDIANAHNAVETAAHVHGNKAVLDKLGENEGLLAFDGALVGGSGEAGPKGEPGPKGEQGEKGDPGATARHFAAKLLSNGWSDTAPYTQAVNISGIISAMTPIVDIILSGDISEKISQRNAWTFVDEIETTDGGIMVTCLEERPDVALSILLKVIE